MEKLEWLEAWVPTGLNSAIRFAAPFGYEQSAATGAANAFTNTVIDLAERQDKIADQTTRATAITVTAAILANYLNTVRERTGREADPDLEEWDDTPPEILKANERIAFCIGVAEGLAGRAKTYLKQAGMEKQPLEYNSHAEEEHENNIKFSEQHLEQQKIAQTASMLGNAAAIEWHLDEMEKLDEETDQEQLGGHILALWANSDNLTSWERNTSLEDPEYTAAVSKRSMAIGRLTTPENLTQQEFSRPVQASPRSVESWDKNHGEFLVGQLWGHGDHSKAMYNWQEDEAMDAIMAYRYQGSTHVKFVTDSYQHPIDRDTALEHCNDMEEAAFENEEPDNPLAEQIIHQAILNRCLVLAGLHQTPAELIHTTLEIAQEAFNENTRVEAFARIISDGYTEVAENIINRQGINQHSLNHEQTKAVLTAARATGATENAMRDMAIRLGIKPEELRSHGIPGALPVPWEDARHILEHTYDLKDPDSPSWFAAAIVMGWEPDDPLIQRLASQLEALNMYGENPDDQPAE